MTISVFLLRFILFCYFSRRMCETHIVTSTSYSHSLFCVVSHTTFINIQQYKYFFLSFIISSTGISTLTKNNKKRNIKNMRSASVNTKRRKIMYRPQRPRLTMFTTRAYEYKRKKEYAAAHIILEFLSSGLTYSPTY